MAEGEDRVELERRRRELEHYVTLGGKIEGRTLIQDLWVTRPHPKGTDLRRVPWRKLRAVVDTGCTDTAIRADIVAELGLPVVDYADVGTASSGQTPERTPLAAAIVMIFENTKREAIEQTLVLAAEMEDEMLLGMDLLDQGILVVDCVHRVWEWRLHAPDNQSRNPYL